VPRQLNNATTAAAAADDDNAGERTNERTNERASERTNERTNNEVLRLCAVVVVVWSPPSRRADVWFAPTN